MRAAISLCFSATAVAATDGLMTPMRRLQRDSEFWHCNKYPHWNNKCADAHVFGVGNNLACDSYEVKAEDINGPCGTPDKPCITAFIDIPTYESPHCNKCYEMTLWEDGKSYLANGSLDDINAVCNVKPEAPETCGAYERTIHVKALDETRAADFEVSQNAWDYLCPYCCKGSSVCVLDKDTCKLGIWETNVSCSYKGVRYQEVECGSACDKCGVDVTPTDKPAATEPAATKPAATVPAATEPAATVAPTTGAICVPGGNSTIAGTVGPVMYSAGTSGACGDPITDADISGGCGTASNPCVAAYEKGGYNKADCGKCFHVTMKEAGGGTNVCNGAAGCAKLEKSVYVKVIDQISTSTFGVNQDGWKSLCPFLCTGGICVEEESSCMSGTLDSATAARRTAAYQAVECGQEVQAGSCAPESAAMQSTVSVTILGAWVVAFTLM